MKFSANVNLLINALTPITYGATKDGDREIAESFKISLSTDNKHPLTLNAKSFGGRIGVEGNIQDLSKGLDQLSFKLLEEGEATISAVDLETSLKSFRPDTIVVVSRVNNEVVIEDSKNKEDVQSLPIMPDGKIEMPKIIDGEDDFCEVKILRSVFIRGLKKVMWAVGDHDHRERYKNWVVRVTPNHIRFVGGSGARFAVLDVDGKGISELTSGKDSNMLFPEEHSSVIKDILDKLQQDDWVTFKYNNKQCIITCGSYTIHMVGYDSGIGYIDENKFLDVADRPYRVVTKVSDWMYASRGVMATFNADIKKVHDTHETDMLIDLDGNCINIKAQTKMRSNRKIPILRVQQQPETDTKINFKVTSVFLSEIAQYADDKSGDVYVEVVTNPNTAVFVKFPETTTGEVKEEFQLFFATMKAAN